MRSKFDQQLSQLNKELIQMGAKCEEVIAMAAKALATGDCELAKNVAPVDKEIDQMERSIEGLCLKLLLQQQPVARDLRQISAALKMITDMERIGDQAEDIAEIVTFLGGRTGARMWSDPGDGGGEHRDGNTERRCLCKPGMWPWPRKPSSMMMWWTTTLSK